MRKRLEHFAHFCLHHELDVHRDFPKRAAHQTKEGAHFGNVVANGMPGNQWTAQAQLAHQTRLRLHRALFDGCQRAASAAKLAHEHTWFQLLQPLTMTLDARENTCRLEAKRHWNRLLQIAATNHRRVTVLFG